MTRLRPSSRRNSWGHKGGKNLLHFVVFLLVSATFLSNRRARPELSERGIYDEPFRPQFHLTPPKNWMNDPNGPVYYQGEYHIFYQFNPFGNEWGHMSWGHAVSPDLIHWRNLPVAIPEQNGVMIFSGSAVVDWNNSSGLCTGSGLPDPSCLVAIYTGYNGKVQNQNLAYSHDHGRTWTKYSGNPILDLHRANFRDPKVFWYRPGRKWVMVVALSDQHQVRFYASEDLIHWAFMSDFGPAGATGGVWECPDLFELPVENRPGERRWVLSVNVNPGSIAGGSGDQYFVGEFDGSKFMNHNSSDLTLWADYGKDFYASTSFSSMPPSDGRRVWLGWLDNWEYAARVPTSPWRGQQSIPRVLKLRRFPQGVRLVQSPVAELHTLRGWGINVEGPEVEAANRELRSQKVEGDTLEIEARIEFGLARTFGIKVRKGASEETAIGIDRGSSILFVDRTHSGNTAFDPHFPGRQSAPLDLGGRTSVDLHIFVDRCSVEVFAGEGAAVISDLIFPAPDSRGIELYADGEVKNAKLSIWKLTSVWRQEASLRLPKRH
jgi:fructan beta-fructosidase